MGAAIAQVTPLLSGRPGDAPLPGGGVLPVHPALARLLPGGLPRGSVVAAGQWGLLCPALAAGASADGAWCAVVGVPEFGLAAGGGLAAGRL